MDSSPRQTVFCALGEGSDEDAAHVAAHIAEVLDWRLVVVFTGGPPVPAGAQRLGDEVALRLRGSRTGSRLLTRLANEHGCDGAHRYWLELGATAEQLAEIALEQDAGVFLLGRSLVRAGFTQAVNAALRNADDRLPTVAAA